MAPGLALAVWHGISFPASTGTSSAVVASQSPTAVVPNLVTAALSVSPSTMPSWIGTLKTASIASDMSAAIINGQVSYSGLLNLLKNVDLHIISSNKTLSAAQLSDLTTIAANLNNGVATSAYLTGIMDSLVLGSNANATWTGGNASSVALGNLAAGSTATTTYRIDKQVVSWDRPSKFAS